MAEITTLLQDVAQVARRCPNPTLVQAYRRAARKFCLESRWLRRELPIVTEADTALYDLLPDTADPMLEIIGVRVVTAQSETPPVQSWRLNASNPLGWRPGAAQRPQVHAYVPEAQLAVYPTPDGAYTLTVTVECQPLIDAVELPDDLLRKWDRAFSDGALGYLLGLPGQAWSSPALARDYQIKAQAAINNAKADVARAYNTGTSMARMRRLF